MTVLSHAAQFTPEELLRLESDGLYELVDGQLVEKKMSAPASEAGIIISSRLFEFVRQRRLGSVYSELTLQCFPNDPGMVRRPDIAFIASDRLKSVPQEGHVPIAPDLAIEIISPSDRINDFEQKLKQYFEAGVKCVWAVSPFSRTVHVHRADGTETKLREADTLSGELILPGFSVLVRELFPLIA